MKVLLSWLRDFAPITGDPVAIGEQLSDLGTPVESLERLGEGLDGIVVARVLATRPHPNAERIQLVDVDTGDGEALQIACGAFNMAPGDLVPLATLGTTMPDGTEIGRRKMRGEWSNGMLCAPGELGLAGDPGILILPPGLTVGAPFAEAMGIERDVLYELEVNPNRPDAMSIAGVARDLAAVQGVPFAIPEPAVEEVPAERSGGVTIEIADPDLCGRFTGRVLRGVTVGESDPLIARRLSLLGMRPINSLVDASNYVMLELGQPSHPYDLAKVRGGRLRARRARPGETLVTLDGVERRFTTDDLLIADGEDRPVGIAGIMGGAETEIDASTTDVLVEMAWFRPIAIAKSSRRLRLRSEASARFEKGVDPEIAEVAHARFAELLAGSGARLEAGVVDVRGELPDRAPVRVRTVRVNRLLNTDLSRDGIAALLDPIGFAATPAGDDDLDVAIPSWRYDSSTEIDVVEEVARMYGYERIGRRVPPSAHTGRLTERQRERRRLRSLLVGRGLSEALPMPFLAPGDLERCGLPGDGLEIANPLVAEESVLRTSLLPGLVKALGTNAARRNTGVSLWEIGHVFRPRAAGDAPGVARANGSGAAPAGDGALPDEREHLGVVLGGRAAPDAVVEWRAVEEVLDLTGVEIRNQPVPGLHPTRSARLVGPRGEPVGAVGEIDPDVLAAHGVAERVGWLEVDLDVVAALPRTGRPYRLVSVYPSSDIDLAFEVADDVPATAVEATLREATGDRLATLRLFDVYRGAGIAPGRRSLAYRLRLEARDHTLTDDEVAHIRRQGIAAVEAAHAATLRG
ncbi:MAG TPA: phenylalanine--tRNA ligase subunit beta [Acidimicrobiales bacterium]|nr:phenylalanine--tRNA ligase subunit beta [Acidimicrobiales bacterium]